MSASRTSISARIRFRWRTYPDRRRRNRHGNVTLVNDDHLIIDERGALVANPAIIWAGGGDAVVDNSGRISGSGRVLNTTTGATGTLTFNNLEGGTVTGPITPQNADMPTPSSRSIMPGRSSWPPMTARSISAISTATAPTPSSTILRVASSARSAATTPTCIRPGAGATVNNSGTITTVGGLCRRRRCHRLPGRCRRQGQQLCRRSHRRLQARRNGREEPSPS